MIRSTFKGSKVQGFNFSGPNYSRRAENSRQSVDRGVTLEERRQQREGLIFWLQLGTLFDLFAANLMREWLPASSWRCRFAFAPEGLRLDP
jgi:hypothetical protein